jgi:hypothetical protein
MAGVKAGRGKKNREGGRGRGAGGLVFRRLFAAVWLYFHRLLYTLHSLKKYERQTTYGMGILMKRAADGLHVNTSLRL